MGYLISIEGGEYVGKTTVVVPGLLRHFQDDGIATIVSREPGGTPEAEGIRREVFQKIREGISPEEQAELFNKARKLHVDQVIRPFLGSQKEKKAVVILDRYLDSTRVYQGLEGGVSFDLIRKLEKEHVGNLLPDITFILYFPEEVFLQTLDARRLSSHTDRMREDIPFDEDDLQKHLERQRLYLQLPGLAKRFGEKRIFIPIDASVQPERVIMTCIEELTRHIKYDILKS